MVNSEEFLSLYLSKRTQCLCMYGDRGTKSVKRQAQAAEWNLKKLFVGYALISFSGSIIFFGTLTLHLPSNGTKLSTRASLFFGLLDRLSCKLQFNTIKWHVSWLKHSINCCNLYDWVQTLRFSNKIVSFRISISNLIAVQNEFDFIILIILVAFVVGLFILIHTWMTVLFNSSIKIVSTSTEFSWIEPFFLWYFDIIFDVPIKYPFAKKASAIVWKI